MSPGRGGVAQDAVEIARDVVDLMRDYDDALIPEVDELRDLLSEPHIRVGGAAGGLYGGIGVATVTT